MNRSGPGAQPDPLGDDPPEEAAPPPSSEQRSPVGTASRRSVLPMNRQVEADFRFLVEGMPDVLFRISPTLDFTYVSPSVRHLLGHEPESVEGRPLLDFVLPEARVDLVEKWKAGRSLRASGEVRPIGPLELPLVHRDGHVVWSEVVSIAHLGPNGELAEYRGITRDISDRKQAEAERVELTAQLHQAMKMEAIGRLAGGIAHDFNNLLMGILGNLELVTDDLSPDHPCVGALADAQLAAESAAALTRQLLSFSRKQLVQPRVIDPNEVVTNLRTMVSRLIGEDVTVDWFLEPGVGPVRIDPGQLEQVLVNLLVNSRDAMPEGGLIRVSTERVSFEHPDAERPPAADRDEYVRLRVMDSGIGMDDSTLQRVFEPFFTTKPHGRGTGLGLATTYGAIRGAGGFIEVESAPGRGATFSIYLPTCTAEGAPTRLRPRTVPPPSRRLMVLLVEDEPMVRGVTLRILERLGYAVLAAASGNEALALAGEAGARMDLLMTDVVMPRMSGLELARRIADIQPGIRVLFTSGHAPDDAIRLSADARGRAFIGKPFTPRALAERLHELLGPQVEAD